MKKVLSILLFLTTIAAYSQTDTVTVDTINDYQGWGWDVVVIQNDYITLAVVPEIGGRILQYDIGTDSMIAVNPVLFGETYPTDGSSSPYSMTWGFGGYKVWPAPQSRWNWPPPPALDWGEYSYTLETLTTDSVVLFMESDIETLRSPDLRFQRRITVYANSTCVRIDQIVINEGDADDSWGVWDVTQSMVQHENTNDYENIAVYFPVTSESETWTSGGAGPSTAFIGEIVPGIYHVEYTPDEGKIFARVPEGWISWVDERDSQTYVKSFELFAGETYPDNNAHVAVYISGSNPYLEVEVMSPVVNLTANGGTYSFIETWYATRTQGPTLHSNAMGAIIETLEFDSESGDLSGLFGTYYSGYLRIVYTDESGSTLGQETDIPVSPMTPVEIDESLTLPENTNMIKLQIFDELSNYIGTLSEVEAEPETEPEPQVLNDLNEENFNVTFNASSEFIVVSQLAFDVYQVSIINLDGKEVLKNNEQYTKGRNIELKTNGIKEGIYVLVLKGLDHTKTFKLAVY